MSIDTKKLEEKLKARSSSLKLIDITKKFLSHDGKEEFIAVDKLNLDIKSGELTTLLGPSGCGKTTTLRMIAGFESITSGTLLLGDQPIESVPPNKRDMSMMFQSYALFPHMSVFDNIAYGLKIKKVPKPELEERTRQIIELMQIQGMEDRIPSQISGGQQQRVALARAVVINPRVLLFDEPLSNLDAKLREYMRDELRSLQKRLGITSLYVTHDQSEAMSISDNVVLMNKGKLVQTGSPKDIYENPVSRFVAGFIGKSNFINCTVLSHENGKADIEVFGKKMTLPNPGTHFDAAKNTVIIVRPEYIKLCDSGKGIVDARIEKAVFYGNYIQYDIRIGEQQLKVESYCPQGIKIYSPGNTAGILFDLNSLRVLPAISED